MKNLSLKMKVLSAVLCAGLTFSGTNISFAAANQESNSVVKPVTSINFKDSIDKEKVENSSQQKRSDSFNTLIKESIDSNIITKDEGDKVLKYVEDNADKKCGDKKRCKKEKGGLFSQLVTEDILTKEKSELLREKMHTKGSKIRMEEMQKGLATLVDNKVLTIEQKVKVEAVIMERHGQRKEEFKKMKTMNEKEKEEYVKKVRDTDSDPMKALVDDGTITKQQMKEIKKVINHPYEHK